MTVETHAKLTVVLGLGRQGVAEPLVSGGVYVELGAIGLLAVCVLGPLIDQAAVSAVERPPLGVLFHEVLLDLRTELFADPSEPAEQRIVAPHGVANLEQIDNGDDDQDADDGGQPTEVSVDPDRERHRNREGHDDDSDGRELWSSHGLASVSCVAIQAMKASTSPDRSLFETRYSRPFRSRRIDQEEMIEPDTVTGSDVGRYLHPL